MSTTAPAFNPAKAQSEYFRRPADERFATVDALVQDAKHQHNLSVTKIVNAKDLHAQPIDGTTADGRPVVALVGPSGNPARMTHWSFGQLSKSIGAPAGYLRELPAELASRCINHGLQNTPPASDFNLLIQAPNGRPEPTIRAATSEQYGRVWDDQLYGQILDQIMGVGKFSLPPTWDGRPAGAYRSDRDSFVIVVNGGSIVTDPSLTNSFYARQQPASTGTQANDANPPADGMYRGLMISNSEVGAGSVTIDQILFRFICGNHMLWGAMLGKAFRRRHIGDKTLRDVIREINSIAFHWTNASAQRDEQIIKALINHEIAQTKEGVIDELRALGFTKKDAEAAYSACEMNEPASPRSFWGIAQGATRISQESGHMDERYDLDALASKVLARGVKQYATV